MAASRPCFVQDQMADLTECSICTEVYTNPKILPCVHTFCLQCLEKYGRNKKTGDQMACPICRSEFLIPDGGFGSLPHNFFIDKMVEIRKLSETPTNEALCGTCPEEERMMAKTFCFECEQNLCERCGIAHSKMKLCQSHQVVEISNKLKTQEVNFRNSYCNQHPGELVKMYCEDDRATICFLCFAESHQSHKCLSATRASEEFSSALKNDLKVVMGRLPAFHTSLQQFDKWKEDLLAQIVDAERQMFEETVKLKALIDSHVNILTKKLTTIKDKTLKDIEGMKQDVDRVKVTVESYVNYCEELLSKGAPGDICREADKLKTRARELASLTTNFSDRDFNYDGIIFKSLKLEDVLRVNSIANIIGDVQSGFVKADPVPILTQDDAILDATSNHQIHENKKQPYTQTSENTESKITTSMTFIFDATAMYFIQKRPELKKHIDDSLENLNCRVEWPSEGKGELNLKFTGKEKQKLISGRDGECKKVLQRYADELTWKKESVLGEIWNDFRMKIQEHVANKSKQLDTAFENDLCEMQYIGLKKDTDEFEKIFSKIKEELEKELKQQKERILRSMRTLKPHELDLIRTEEFQKKLWQEIPDLVFEVKKTEVNLCGTPDVLKRARLFILDKLAVAAQDSIELSESRSKVFAKDEAKPYLMKQLLSKGITASWMYNDGRVHVFAFDDKNLKEAVRVLQNEVVEKCLQLSALHLREGLFQSHKWKDFIGWLYAKDKLLEVSISDSVLTVTCMNSSFERYKSRIEVFFTNSLRLYYPYSLLLFKTRSTYQWQ